MGILIGDYEFDGPYSDGELLEDRAGVFAVLHRDQDLFELVELGHADNLGASLRKEFLASVSGSCHGPIVVAACYTPGLQYSERRSIVESILREFGEVEEPIAS